MVAWEWLVQRRGISIDDIVRSGIDTYEGVQKYFQIRGATSPSQEQFAAAFIRVNPPTPEVPERTLRSKPAPKKTPVRRSRKKKAT